MLVHSCPRIIGSPNAFPAGAPNYLQFPGNVRVQDFLTFFVHFGVRLTVFAAAKGNEELQVHSHLHYGRVTCVKAIFVLDKRIVFTYSLNKHTLRADYTQPHTATTTPNPLYSMPNKPFPPLYLA